LRGFLDYEFNLLSLELLNMIRIKDEEILEIWGNLVYAPKQVRNRALELTIKSIDSFYSHGQLDFGGSEYKSAILELVNPKIIDDPKYGWWAIEQGNYLVTYNEIMKDESYYALISPHQRLIDAGGTHSSFFWYPTTKDQPIKSILQVGKKGLMLKENARVSTAISFRDS
jgi:hypothetical protein